ncbi:MAG: U32 family peptidase [Ruminiclostridium sp.]|nr:U32 family peptidase [Ruminiclostridium sp.]
MIELLSPAGDYECLESAVDYGADAVYLGSTMFGMRAAAAKFDFDTLKKGIEYAHKKNVKVYLTCNIVPSNDEVEMLPEFIKNAYSCGIDAAIVSDIGALSVIKNAVPELSLHISTQAGVVNYVTANELYKMGADRIVLAREVDIDNIRRIRDKIPADMDIEAFVHGAMCVSFSGRCLLSSFMVDRNANKGECAQPCRWKYHLVEEKRPGEYYELFEDDRGSYILNAKDMCMIEHLDKLKDAGVTSFKIEGRAKSAYYVAVVTNAYRAAMDAVKNNEAIPEWAIEEVYKVSHRQYSTGFYLGKDNASQYYENSGYIRDFDFVGVVDSCENGIINLTQRNYFTVHDELEILSPGKKPVKIDIPYVINSKGEKTEIANRATEKLQIESELVFPPHSILRKPVNKQ